MSSSTPQAASSWLRDLIMGTEYITAKARMTPLKSAARSRFTELRIHSKKDIFENCNLENSLRQYVDMLKLLNLEIGDDELQREACSIVSHMSDASPMFTNLLVALINGSTKWLVPFRSRTGLPFVETEINLQLDGRETENRGATSLDLDILQQILAEDKGHNTLGHAALALNPASSNQRVVSLNDGNMYRGLTRDLTRYVARTISPLNPTSHVPTDEELQYQARWIMYDRCVNIGSPCPTPTDISMAVMMSGTKRRLITWLGLKSLRRNLAFLDNTSCCIIVIRLPRHRVISAIRSGPAKKSRPAIS